MSGPQDSPRLERLTIALRTRRGVGWLGSEPEGRSPQRLRRTWGLRRLRRLDPSHPSRAIRVLSALAFSLPALAALVLAAAALAADGPDKNKVNNKAKDQPAARKPATPEGPPTPEAEAAALAFVR